MNEESKKNKWFTVSAAEVLVQVETDPAKGLGPPEAAARLNRYGPNEP